MIIFVIGIHGLLSFQINLQVSIRTVGTVKISKNPKLSINEFANKRENIKILSCNYLYFIFFCCCCQKQDCTEIIFILVEQVFHSFVLFFLFSINVEDQKETLYSKICSRIYRNLFLFKALHVL